MSNNAKTDKTLLFLVTATPFARLDLSGWPGVQAYRMEVNIAVSNGADDVYEILEGDTEFVLDALSFAIWIW